MKSLFRPFHREYSEEGLEDDLHIQPEAEVADVFVVELHDLLEVGSSRRMIPLILLYPFDVPTIFLSVGTSPL